jgi:peptidoglycan/xylan/chitin deacetylase (PgdA/CDA1 family)
MPTTASRAAPERSLTIRSERLYGLGRGLERVLAALAETGAAGTFYVPGVTARAHPEAVAAILEGGHELGHHGEAHLRPDAIDEARQRAEVEQGITSLTEIAGEPPAGYRAPGWALTETTLELLGEFRLTWDSSLMQADEPYRLTTARGPLWELPVQWALDDAAWLAHPSDPAGMLAVWTAELAAARREDRHVSLTIHSEIMGVAHRVDGLRRLLDALAGRGTALISHGRLVADRLGPC